MEIWTGKTHGINEVDFPAKSLHVWLPDISNSTTYFIVEKVQSESRIRVNHDLLFVWRLLCQFIYIYIISVFCADVYVCIDLWHNNYHTYRCTHVFTHVFICICTDVDVYMEIYTHLLTCVYTQKFLGGHPQKRKSPEIWSAGDCTKHKAGWSHFSDTSIQGRIEFSKNLVNTILPSK